MGLNEFIEFLKELGFKKTWGKRWEFYHLQTDVIGPANTNHMAYRNQIDVHIQGKLDNYSILVNHGNYNSSSGDISFKSDLVDFDKYEFIESIMTKFDKVPDNMIKYLRDIKINKILKNG